jgi:hypothetical protein
LGLKPHIKSEIEADRMKKARISRIRRFIGPLLPAGEIFDTAPAGLSRKDRTPH